MVGHEVDHEAVDGESEDTTDDHEGVDNESDDTGGDLEAAWVKHVANVIDQEVVILICFMSLGLSDGGNPVRQAQMTS